MVSNPVSRVGDKIGKIPVHGDVAKFGLGGVRLAMGLTAILAGAGLRVLRGQKLGTALRYAVSGQIDAVRDVLKLAEMVAPFIPGIGTGVAATLGAANALSAGRPITEALGFRALSSPLVQKGFDAAWIVFQIEEGGLTAALGLAGEEAARAILPQILGVDPDLVVTSTRLPATSR